ncbi:MAG: hypothetical protein IKR04_07140 [Clostridia bacterium]|nr:hypothetical protein [Clostridia bacterium]
MIKKLFKPNIILFTIISFIIVEIGMRVFSIDNNCVLDVICTIALTFLINYLYKNIELIKNKTSLITSSIYSFLISMVLMLQSKIVFSGNVYGGKPDENYFLDFAFIDFIKVLAGFAVVFVLVLNLLIVVKKYEEKLTISDKESVRISNVKFFFICFALIAIPFTLYLLTYAPGAVLGDSTYQIGQALGKTTLNNHHPVVHTYFLGFFMRLGENFDNYNVGVLLHSIFQIVLISLGLAYFLLWLKKKNVRLIYLLLVYFYFVANTVFAAYSIIMWKDPLFCLAIFLISLIMFDAIKSNGVELKKPSTIAWYIVYAFIIIFFRNNGIYIVIASTLALLIMYNKKVPWFAGITIVFIALSIIIPKAIYDKNKITTPYKELLGIPLQQIAGTINYSGDINEEEKEYLESITSFDNWKSLYKPMCVDVLKNSNNFKISVIENDKAKFFGTWFSLLPKNLSRYIKSYLLGTYGFWSIETKNSYGFVDTYIINNRYGIERTDYIKNLLGFSLEDVWYSKVDYLGSGTLFWIMMLSIILLINKKASKYIVIYIPAIACFATIMLATPVAFSLRYVFMFAYMLPLFIICPFMDLKQNKIKEKKKK